MKSIFAGIVCRVLTVSLMVLPWHAQAGLIGTEQAQGPAQQRAAVAAFLARDAAAAQLESFGISRQEARERVAALSDADVAALAGRIDALPAGGTVPWGIIFAVAIVFWLAIWKPHYSESATAPAAKGKTTPAPAPEKK